MNRRDLLIIGGTALASPSLACAQQKVIPMIGYLGIASAGGYVPFITALRRGLGEYGYMEGQNLRIEYRWAEGRHDRPPALAADLVGRHANLIIATGGDAGALTAKQATSTIPIVFVSGGDPVGEGVVASLAWPGGNVTGVSLLTFELAPKRFELTLELAPEAKVVVLLANPNNSSWQHSRAVVDDVTRDARAKGLELHILTAARSRRSLPRLRRSANCTPAGSLSEAMRSSTAGATSLSRWRRAMPGRRFLNGASSRRPAA